MTPDASSNELTGRVQQGDKEALVEYIELKRPLLAFIGRSMSDQMLRRVEPQDILQETIVYALSSFDNYDLGDRDPFSWLCQIGERRIIDNHRKLFAEKRSVEKEQPLDRGGGGEDQGNLINILVNSMTSPSEAFSRNQRESRMLTAISGLPQLAQDVIRMRYVEGLPTKEIAEKLGKNDGAIRVMLTRTLKKLEEVLQDDTWLKK